MSRTPLVIYVLWHPKAEDGAQLASQVYRWFHLASDDLLRAGMGVPVFFRSVAQGASGSAPRPIELSEADLNVVVVLAESNLVADPAWNEYVEQLHASNTHVIPVALSVSAYRLPESVRRLNFVRVDERDDPPASAAETLARRTPRLLRQLTEVISRKLAARLSPASESARSAPPLTIFLSHAKRDGVDVAEALRSKIQDGRVRAFFDESDLPVGHAFAAELESAAVAGSAAMIAIVSDAYAARPWCRHEVTLARAPRLDPGAQRCWWSQPLVVVDALKEAPTRNIPELGSATLVRWTNEGALAMLDLLMVEILLSSYHRLRARRIETEPGQHVISWSPDVPTLLALQRAASEPVKRVIYPGNHLAQTDLQSLRRLFPDLELVSYEQLERAFEPAAQPLTGRLVGLSAALNEDLGRMGLGREHLEEITLRVARCVVELGARIAFGGMLKTNNLAETLLTLVRTLRADHDLPSPSGPLPGILSYQRWPALPSSDQIANDVGICEYVLIDNPLPSERRITDDQRVTSPERARQLAHVISRMRTAMASGGSLTTAGRTAPPLAARILLGGVRHGFNSFIPGLLEEALYSLEAGHPVYIIGGFGGASRLLADVILGKQPLTHLDVAYYREHCPRFEMLQIALESAGEGELPALLLERLRARVQILQGDLEKLDNGLDAPENRQLMESDHVAEIIQLLRIGLHRKFGAATQASA